MHGATVPLWVVALVLAALAPFAARFVALAMQQRTRRRSKRILGTSSQRE